MSKAAEIEKIKTLLLKARKNSGATESEREVSRNMAYKLMEKHSITKEMIIGKAKSDQNKPVGPWHIKVPREMYEYEPFYQVVKHYSGIWVNKTTILVHQYDNAIMIQFRARHMYDKKLKDDIDALKRLKEERALAAKKEEEKKREMQRKKDQLKFVSILLVVAIVFVTLILIA